MPDDRGVLPPGSAAITFYDTTYGVPGGDDPGRVRVHMPAGSGVAGAGFADVPTGVVVRVVDDPGPDGDRTRAVRVTIGGGEYAGIAATIARDRLRPVAR